MAAFSIMLFLVVIYSGLTNGCKKNSDCPSGFCNGGSLWSSGRCAALVRPKINESLFVLPISSDVTIILEVSESFMFGIYDTNFHGTNCTKKINRSFDCQKIYHFSLDLKRV